MSKPYGSKIGPVVWGQRETRTGDGPWQWGGIWLGFLRPSQEDYLFTTRIPWLPRWLVRLLA